MISDFSFISVLLLEDNVVILLISQEVAVKKFLDQDITGESLLEFKSEVKRLFVYSLGIS